MEFGVKESCTKRIVSATNRLGRRDVKGATNDCLIFDSWCYSKRPEEAAMDVGADIIGMVKTNTKGFCK